MSPRTVTIFLASSEELIHDRNSFHSLIASLDDIYEPRGIRVKLKRWEDFIAHCTGSRTQDDYNKVLTACDISVCMFHCKGGKFTIEEFEKSVESYKLTHSPKPYVYVRALVEGEVEEETLTKFKKKLFEQMGHYWCNYATDDAMKLHFVMQFERLLNADMQSLEQESNLRVDRGSVLLYGKKIADYANLPFASENDEMKILKEKIAMLDKEVVQFRAMNIKELRPIITQKLTEYNECQQRLERLEKQLLDMALFISKMISNGNLISERKRLAVEMFEKGNYKGVMEVLNEADIVSDFEHAKAELASGWKVVETGEVMVANAEQKIRSLVEEFIMKAKTWMSTYSAPHRFESACKCYEQAIQMTRESLQMKDLAEILFEYALFLLENKQYNRAEAYCKEALSISIHLASQDPEVYNSGLAKILNNLAVLYADTQRFADAEMYYQRALAIFERLASQHPEVHESNVSMTFNNLADVYYKTQRFSDAERYFQRALAIFERLASQDPEAYNSDLAQILNNLANVYYKTQRFADAEAYYQRSLAMYERLASQHREMHESNVAMTLNNLANVYYNMQRFADAEACYQRSLVMYERLASEHPETYESDLAMTLNSLANVYYNTQFFTDAEEYCLRSLSIYERLVAANPDIYGYSYAGSLMSAAYYSLFNKKYAQSEEYSREALKWSDDIYIYTNLAAAILLQGRYDEAKQIYLTYKDNLKDSFLEDIQMLKENNAIPSHLNKDVDNIVELLLSDLQ